MSKYEDSPGFSLVHPGEEAKSNASSAITLVIYQRNQARRRVAELEFLLADAPHADECTYLQEDVVEPYGTRISPNAHCNCWKAGP